VTRGALPSLLIALLATAPAAGASAPILQTEASFGTLRVVHLEDFDPTAPGDVVPPVIPYHDHDIDPPLEVVRPGPTTEELLRRLPGDPATMSGRELVLAVVELTRDTVAVPLLAPGLDEAPLEDLLTSGRGICRHQARFAEAAFALLQPHCPAARDVRLSAFGDRFTHSWLRATAAVPEGDDWTVVETHVDVAAPRAAHGRPALDLASGDLAESFPLVGMILLRAGLVERARWAWLAYADEPDCPRRGAALVGLLEALVERGEHAQAASIVDETLGALGTDEGALRARDSGVTPEQHAELLHATYLSLQRLHEAGAPLPASIPDPRRCEQARTEARQLRDALVAFGLAADDAIARGDVAAATAAWEAGRAQAGDNAGAWDAALADALRRGGIACRRAGHDDLALQLCMQRRTLRPEEPGIGDELANAALLRLQALERGEAVALQTVREAEPLLPARSPETFLVRARLAELDGQPDRAAEHHRALIDACDALPGAGGREQLFALHGLVSLQHRARELGDADDVRAMAEAALPRLVAASAEELSGEQHENLAVLWWDTGITLTIVDRDPDLAVQVWEAFVAWAPADHRARYGLARGLVQRAHLEVTRARTDGDRERATRTARAALAALRHAVTLDVPIPDAQRYLRLAWFNLATVFESAGLLVDALAIARALDEALPEEHGGAVLTARTLGLMAADAHRHDTCGETGGLLDEGEALLSRTAGADLPEHLHASTAVAHHSLAVGAASCGDVPRALELVEVGLSRFPDDARLMQLQGQLSALTP